MFKNGLPGERRTYIDFIEDENKVTSYSTAVQIVGRNTKTGRKYGGSGSLISYAGESFILTAAHNIVEIDPETDEPIYNEDLYAYSMRIGQDTYRYKFKITDSVVYPDYDGDDLCGFDIAVCKVEKLPGSNVTADYYSTK